MNSALSAGSASTTLRPRNRRNLIDDDPQENPSTRQLEPTGERFSSSRPTSPNSQALSSQYGSRSSSTLRSRSRGTVPSGATQASQSTFTSGLWGNSLNALRGIASDILGASTSRATSPGVAVGSTRNVYASTTLPGQTGRNLEWGPSDRSHREVGSGTQERTRAELEAKRRERLLIAQDHLHSDGWGRYKRRGSNEREHASMPPSGSDDRDALIYVHKVTKGDTMAGILIKYNCESQSFRKANRLWPNDSIQSRKVVVLPVESCGKKGRRISEAELAAMQTKRDGYFEDVAETPVFSMDGQSQDLLRQNAIQNVSSMPVSPSLSTSLSAADEASFEHDSWVLISGFEAPTEVARLSRRALGYFPRTRRKSQNLSDMGTPAHSFDLPRNSFQSEPLSHSPSNSVSHFRDLRGPGGVGSMDRNVRSPGPANDGLNKLFPGMERKVALRSNYFSDLSSSQSAGFENLGGSIETWVRKLANKASSMQAPNAMTSANGDLIELSEDAFESITTKPNEDSHRRGRSPTIDSYASSPNPDGLLLDSFSPRGKVFHEASKRRD